MDFLLNKLLHIDVWRMVLKNCWNKDIKYEQLIDRPWHSDAVTLNEKAFHHFYTQKKSLWQTARLLFGKQLVLGFLSGLLLGTCHSLIRPLLLLEIIWCLQRYWSWSWAWGSWVLRQAQAQEASQLTQGQQGELLIEQQLQQLQEEQQQQQLAEVDYLMKVIAPLVVLELFLEGFVSAQWQRILGVSLVSGIQNFVSTLIVQKVAKRRNPNWAVTKLFRDIGGPIIGEEHDDQQKKQKQQELWEIEKQKQQKDLDAEMTKDNESELQLVQIHWYGKIISVAWPGWIFPANIWSLSIGSTFIVYKTQWWGVMTLLTFVVLVKVAMTIGNSWVKYRTLSEVDGDSRIGILSEALHNIKGIKYAAWEAQYFRMMKQIRVKELWNVEKFFNLRQRAEIFAKTIPLISSIVLVFFYGFVFGKQEDMTTEVIYPCLLIIAGQRIHWSWFPINCINFVGWLVSLRKIEWFLRQDEWEDERGMVVDNGDTDETKQTNAISTLSSTDGSGSGTEWVTFSVQKANVWLAKQVEVDDEVDEDAAQENKDWAEAQSISKYQLINALQDVTVNINPGLTMIVGPTASGKTVFLQALMAQLEVVSDSDDNAKKETGINFDFKNYDNSIGFCPQQSFILPSTVRDNIVLGRDVSEGQIKWAADAWWLICLDSSAKNSESEDQKDQEEAEDEKWQDLTLDTVIGERGITMSGGQQQRLFFWRAILTKPKVLLLDDPTSALDKWSWKKLFENLVWYTHRIWDTKWTTPTVILVTSHARHLPFSDCILQFDKGNLVQSGKFWEFLEQQQKSQKQLQIQQKKEQLEKNNNEQNNLEQKQEQGEEAGRATVSVSAGSIIVEMLQEHVTQDRDWSKWKQEQIQEIISWKQMNSQNPVTPPEGQSQWKDLAIVNQNQKLQQKETKTNNYNKNQSVVIREEADTGAKAKFSLRGYLSLFGPHRLPAFILWVLANSTFASGEVCLALWMGQLSRRRQKEWLGQNVNVPGDQELTNYYIIFYFLCAPIGMTIQTFSSAQVTKGCVRAGKSLHDRWLLWVLHAPSSYFVQTPTAEILGAFSTDLNWLDITATNFIETFFRICGEVFQAFLVYMWFFPMAQMVFGFGDDTDAAETGTESPSEQDESQSTGSTILNFTLRMVLNWVGWIPILIFCTFVYAKVIVKPLTTSLRDTKRHVSVALNYVLENLNLFSQGRNQGLCRKNVLLGDLKRFFEQRHFGLVDSYCKCWNSSMLASVWWVQVCYLLSGSKIGIVLLLLQWILIQFQEKQKSSQMTNSTQDQEEELDLSLLIAGVNWSFVVSFSIMQLSIMCGLVFRSLMQLERIYWFFGIWQEENKEEFIRQRERDYLKLTDDNGENSENSGNGNSSWNWQSDRDATISASDLDQIQELAEQQKQDKRQTKRRTMGSLRMSVNFQAFRIRKSIIQGGSKSEEEHGNDKSKKYLYSDTEKQKPVAIKFENVNLRYQPFYPLALRGISFTAYKGEHVGLCGASGSGKSSITNALFRLHEIENDNKGKICLGSTDISNVPLHKLRQNMIIVPQRPFVFTGTLRKNLDPFGQYSESEVAEAFDLVFNFAETKGADDFNQFNNEQTENKDENQDSNKIKNKSTITSNSMSSGSLSQSELTLNTVLEVDGTETNISWGQLQLIGIARTLLRKQTATIIVLDEPTSQLDAKTDNYVSEVLVQEQLREHCVLIVAHRMQTLDHCDKIIVMDKGTIVEMGSVEELNAKGEKGFFRQLHTSESDQQQNSSNSQSLMSVGEVQQPQGGQPSNAKPLLPQLEKQQLKDNNVHRVRNSKRASTKHRISFVDPSLTLMQEGTDAERDTAC